MYIHTEICDIIQYVTNIAFQTYVWKWFKIWINANEHAILSSICNPMGVL